MDGRVVMALASGASGATRVSSILTPFTYLFFVVFFILFLFLFYNLPFTFPPPFPIWKLSIKKRKLLTRVEM